MCIQRPSPPFTGTSAGCVSYLDGDEREIVSCFTHDVFWFLENTLEG